MKTRSLLLKLALCMFVLGIFPTPQVQAESDPCKRIILTLLAPYIQEQLDLHYTNKPYKSVQFAPFLEGSTLKFQYMSSHIEVELEVSPYIGPHNSVGDDYLKFNIDNTGKVSLLQYKHLKDYPLPPHYR